jgi:hypothetical protein
MRIYIDVLHVCALQYHWYLTDCYIYGMKAYNCPLDNVLSVALLPNEQMDNITSSDVSLSLNGTPRKERISMSIPIKLYNTNNCTNETWLIDQSELAYY